MTASTKLPVATLVLVAVLLGVAPGKVIHAQTTQPTAEQMRMLNQLPPAQREQALSALRQAQLQAEAAAAQSSITEPLTQPQQQQQLSVEDLQRLAATKLLATGGSRVVINLVEKPSLTARERAAIAADPVLAQLQGSHFYQLDENAVLSLPGLVEIPLMGLDDGAITRRLGAVPALQAFNVSAVLLNEQPTGVEALKLFGYDLFQNNEVGFDPPMAGPVPPDYILGPGDSVRVQLFGNINGVYEFEIDRDGTLTLPELGPVTVSGLTFSEFRADLRSRVEKTLIGTQVSVTMGQLRTVRVFVLGDAARPGSYVVSSLATISSALYQSGGLSEIGSMRNVALKRQGSTVATLDLYDLLLKGDTSADRRLQSGDVIFVPPIGKTVGVSGAVRRPAIYEVKEKSTVADVIRLAGGLNPDAFAEAARVERIDPAKGRVVLSVDAAGAVANSTVVMNGDTLVVPKVLPEINDAVVLSGQVQRPGTYEWRQGMLLTDLVPSALDLAPGSDPNYVLIRRESKIDRTVEVLSADLGAALRNPGSAANVPLQGRDSVFVFSLEYGRQRVIAPILNELRLQSQFDSPFGEVTIGGQVRAPGQYPLEAGMRITDLIRAGGSLREGAYATTAELTRYAVIDGEYRAKEIVEIDLDAILRGDPAADLELASHDDLSISLVPDWNKNWSVTVDGEVKFPGNYQILQGETLSELIERAGGLTENAFPQGAIFLRESLRQREREQMDLLAARMEAELTAMSLETLDTTGRESLQTGQSLLTQLRGADPVGRLVIDIQQITTRNDSGTALIQDIELRDGDRLLVPVASQEVTVIGEAQQPTSHLYQPGLSRDDYIALSGGLTRRADKKLIYVVRASGAVIASNQSKWFGRGGSVEIQPGDTIVAPLETDRIRPISFWTQVTQILYQGAIAVAAVKTFNN